MDDELLNRLFELLEKRAKHLLPADCARMPPPETAANRSDESRPGPSSLAEKHPAADQPAQWDTFDEQSSGIAGHESADDSDGGPTRSSASPRAERPRHRQTGCRKANLGEFFQQCFALPDLCESEMHELEYAEILTEKTALN